MDYTLIHYDVNMWEGRAYKYGMQYLREVGCPVEGLTFDPDLVIRGLIIDKERGNLLKVDRFGYEVVLLLCQNNIELLLFPRLNYSRVTFQTESILVSRL